MKLPDLHDRKTQLALGGAGAVVAFALYKRHAAAAASASSTTGTAGSLTDPVASAAFDASTIETNVVGDLQPQIDSLSAQLAGVKPGLPGPAGPPGAPGKAATPTPPPTVKKPTSAASFPVKIPKNGLPGDPLVDLGIVGPGAIFTGRNVKGGAPVYAIIGNSAVQNFDPKKLAPGTHLATLKAFASSIVPKVVKERL